MEHREALLEALRLSNAQLELLRLGNVDGYLEGLAAYSDACARVTGLQPDTLPQSERDLLLRIEQLNRALLEEGRQWLAGARARLAALRQSQSLSGAYDPEPSTPPLRSQSA